MLEIEQQAPSFIPQSSTTVEDVVAILSSTKNPTQAAHEYISAFPCQAAESAFFILAVSVLKCPEAPAELKTFAEGLVTKVSDLLV